MMTAATPLATCLRNLLDNATRHHDDPSNGHVAVRAAYAEPHFVTLTVVDDGPGFTYRPLDTASTGIDPVTGNRSGDHAGSARSGIGLEVVRRICTLHGATFAAGPGPEGGTVCTLRWPATVAPASGTPRPGVGAPLDVGGPVIDLRDDPRTEPSVMSKPSLFPGDAGTER